jgi:hypothetical protein
MRTPLVSSTKRGKSAVSEVKYLPRAHLFAILCDN